MAGAGLDTTPYPGAHHVESVNDPETIRLLRTMQPTVIVVNGTRIISSEVLDAVDCPFINTHAGITPRFRGVHGGYWALVEGRPEMVGTTVHLVDEGIDTGGVLARATFDTSPCRLRRHLSLPASRGRPAAPGRPGRTGPWRARALPAGRGDPAGRDAASTCTRRCGEYVRRRVVEGRTMTAEFHEIRPQSATSAGDRPSGRCDEPHGSDHRGSEPRDSAGSLGDLARLRAALGDPGPRWTAVTAGLRRTGLVAPGRHRPGLGVCRPGDPGNLGDGRVPVRLHAGRSCGRTCPTRRPAYRRTEFDPYSEPIGADEDVGPRAPGRLTGSPTRLHPGAGSGVPHVLPLLLPRGRPERGRIAGRPGCGAGHRRTARAHA